MQGPDRIRAWCVWSTFLWWLFDPRTYRRYGDFLRKQGFKDFLRISLYSIRHRTGEALVWRLQIETSTFHLGCGEYAVLPLDWTTILGIKFDVYPISTDDMGFEMAFELLGIPLPLTTDVRGYFGPTALP